MRLRSGTHRVEPPFSQCASSLPLPIIQDQEDKPDYIEEASSELNKIMQKAIMLTEMLNEVKPGQVIGRGDAFEVRLSTSLMFKGYNVLN